MATLTHTTVYIPKDFTEEWRTFKKNTKGKTMKTIRDLIVAFNKTYKRKG